MKIFKRSKKLMATTDIVELTGQGSFQIKLPSNYSDFSWTIVSGPGLPLPASNGQDAEFVNVDMQVRKTLKFPFTATTVAVVTYMVLEPRVIEYSIS
jgi:hypothetical protein